MNELLCEILSICRKIDTQTKADCFFEYFGHTGTYYLMVFPNGWRGNMPNDEWRSCCVAQSESVCMTALVETKERLLKIAAELGVEL